MIVQNYDDVNLASVVGVYLDIALELHMSQGIKLESDFRLRLYLTFLLLLLGIRDHPPLPHLFFFNIQKCKDMLFFSGMYWERPLLVNHTEDLLESKPSEFALSRPNYAFH